MSGDDFIALAIDLLSRPASPALHRTIIGRAYYGGFHLAEALLQRTGFVIGRLENAYVTTQRYLCNCGNAEIAAAGYLLADLHRSRLLADYRLGDRRCESREEVEFAVARARQIAAVLAQCTTPNELAQVREGIERYIQKTSGRKST